MQVNRNSWLNFVSTNTGWNVKKNYVVTYQKYE